MSQPIRATKKNIDPIVTAAIDAHLGGISSLPSDAKSKIIEVYRTFFTAYLYIGRVKGFSEDQILDHISDLDQDLIEYMQHFFSDYQDLYRSFINLNRLARELLQIDSIKYPKQFDDQVKALISGEKQFSDALVFDQLLSIHDTDKHERQN